MIDFIDHQICFAVKSNSNIAVLNVLAKLGAGFYIVSGGELARVLNDIDKAEDQLLDDEDSFDLDDDILS